MSEDGKMKVVLSGIYYPMAILRYFEAALRRRSDVELYTVGPYTGTWIPWDGGMHLPTKYAKQPDFPLTADGSIPNFTPIGYIENQLPWQPDLWLQIDAGFFLRGNPAHGKNVIVATDPHVLNYSQQRQLADTFYCMQTPYIQDGDEYLPYAYDPAWHAPEEQPQNYDVCLIGLHYPNRNLLMEELKRRGMKTYYDLGPCFDEARALYNQAPIGINWSSLKDLTARVFELTAMKRLAVVNWVPDLDRFFNNEQVAIFDRMEEAIDLTTHYYSHPHEAKAKAERGYEVVKPHTWDARIETILEGV